MKSTGIWLVVVVVVFLGFTSAWAEEPAFTSPLDKRFTFYGGAQFYSAEGEFSDVREGRPDFEVDLDDLGLDDNLISPAFGAIINFWNRRLTMRFDYFGYHDDANATAEFNFEFDDQVYPINASLDSNLDIDLYVVNLSYNFIRTERAKLGLGFGVHAADIDLGISGTVNGVTVASGDTSLLAPLPNLYLMGAYAFNEKFLLRYGGGWFSMKYGDYDGNLWFAKAFLEYWPWEHFGFGAGYRYLDADVEYDPGHKVETYEFTLPGPMVYVTAGF